jgi:nucleotide-binding universal stress UspA family protein
MSSSFEKVKKILIATDGSSYSANAAEYGVGIAKMLKAEVLAVNVVDDVVLVQLKKFSDNANVEQEMSRDGQKYVDYVVNLAKKQGVKAEAVVTKGQPFEQIVKLAQTSKIDLIVMGTHGYRGSERILIGSVTTRVIEYSSCPVLVCR